MLLRFFSLQNLICWSSQHYYPYNIFDIVYALLIPQRNQCIFSDGMNLEYLLIKIRDEIMYTDILARQEDL